MIILVFIIYLECINDFCDMRNFNTRHNICVKVERIFAQYVFVTQYNSKCHDSPDRGSKLKFTMPSS